MDAIQLEATTLRSLILSITIANMAAVQISEVKVR
jgi:hypothetical protein